MRFSSPLLPSLLALLVSVPLAVVGCSDEEPGNGGSDGASSSSGGSSGKDGSSGGSSSGGASSGGTNPGVPVSYTCKRDIHVATNGDDSASGADETQPMKTIAAAVRKSAPGDCIKVHEGTYRVTSTITFPKDGTQDAPIVLWSVDGPRKAVIDASGNRGATFRISQDFVIIDGFDFQNAPTNNGEQVIHIDGKNAGKGRGTALRNNRITGGHDHIKLNQGTDGVTIEGNEFYGSFGHIPISLTGANNLVFRRNYCHDWKVGDSGAVQIKGGSHDSVFDGNRFENVDTAAGAIALGDGCDASCDMDPEHFAGVRLRAINNLMINVGRGFDVQGCKDCAILANTIIDSGQGNVIFKLTSATTGGVTKSSQGTRILNNLIANRAGDLRHVIQVNSGSGAGLVMDHNFVWNGNKAVTWGDGHPSSADANSITRQDPKFVGPNDFELAAGSPAIGKGQNLIGDVPHDFDGTPRPATGPFDIGAFQTTR